MPDLTEKEYDVLDEYWTTHTPKLSGNGKGGVFITMAEKHGRDHILFVDDVTATWLRAKSFADRTTPEEIVRKLVHREITAAAWPDDAAAAIPRSVPAAANSL